MSPPVSLPVLPLSEQLLDLRRELRMRKDVVPPHLAALCVRMEDLCLGLARILWALLLAWLCLWPEHVGREHPCRKTSHGLPDLDFFFFLITNEWSLAWSRPIGQMKTHPETSSSQSGQTPHEEYSLCTWQHIRKYLWEPFLLAFLKREAT